MQCSPAAVILCLVATHVGAAADKLTLDGLFPDDRVLDVQITIKERDWDTLRFVSRDFSTALSARRRTEPAKNPYPYVEAKVVIDGVEFTRVGIRKKGFIGSQSSLRPSLKIKLNHFDKKAQIGGLSILTFNNNKQDASLMSQFMGYRLFNSAGSPAPRCSYAKVTLNGVNLGVYTHVESARKPLVRRGFGNDKGTLYEGTVTDFFAGWEDSFQRKVGKGKGKAGRRKIKQLIAALQGRDGDAVVDDKARGRAFVPTSKELDGDWTRPEFDDSKWKAGINGAGFETQSGFEHLISKEFDFKNALHTKHTSVYLRFPFQWDAAKITAKTKLLLKMKYDDGFVAYLNGVRVAAANAPKEVRWDSRATGSPDDRSATRFAAFDISKHKDKLHKGRNVLAIHGMNVNPKSSDMLFVARLETNDYDYEQMIGKAVDLDAFYTFWAMEGLLGFWDGYSGNRNNFYFYHNPATDKIHFMPWGADALFARFSRLRQRPGAPMSVKTNGLLAHRLYQLDSGRARYARTIKALLKEHWNEKKLLAEVDRIEAMIKPHLAEAQELRLNTEPIRDFIRKRRLEIEAELVGGMPIWSHEPGEPPAIPERGQQQIRERQENAKNTIWNVARQGDVDAIQDHLNKGVKIDAQSRSGQTVLSEAAAGGHLEAVEFLISKGADVKAKNRDNSTALHIAAFFGRLDVVKLLVSSGAEVNAISHRRETPLNQASTPWQYVQDRIEYMADNLRMKIALKKIKANRALIAEYLRKRGAKTGQQLQPLRGDNRGRRRFRGEDDDDRKRRDND